MPHTEVSHVLHLTELFAGRLGIVSWSVGALEAMGHGPTYEHGDPSAHYNEQDDEGVADCHAGKRNEARVVSRPTV